MIYCECRKKRNICYERKGFLMNFHDILNDPYVSKHLSLPCVYPANYVLHHERERCENIGIIISGSLDMIHYTKDGDALHLATLDAQSMYGDFLVFSAHPYFPGNLVVREKAAIVHIDLHTLDYLIKTSDIFRRFYLRSVGDKAISFNMQNKMLRQPTLQDKVLFYIEHARTREKKEKISITSKTHLAQLLNVRRPSLSRTLSQLRAEGVLDYDRTHIWLL